MFLYLSISTRHIRRSCTAEPASGGDYPMIKTVPRPRFAILVVLACVGLLSGLPAQPARGQDRPADISTPKFEAIPALLRKAVDQKQIAGGATLIARQGKVVHRSAVGMQDIEGKVPMSHATVFRIASMSKPITSVAVMILVDDGKLSVTDPLSRYVPEFKDMKVLVPSDDGKSYQTVAATREITIHDLLTHTSGITYRLLNKPFVAKLYAETGVSDGLSETPGTVGDNVRKLAKLPLVCQPGAAWEYGLNTDVLGHVVEVVSGKSLEDFCRERIFKPLKMNDTCFVLPKEKRSRLSALYAVGPDKSITRVGDRPVTQDGLVYTSTYPTRDDSKYFSGGAGLVSTTGDYFRFGQMMLNGGELDGNRVLKRETVARMTQNQLGQLRIPFPGADQFGYGFGVLGDKARSETKDPAGIGTYSWAGAFNTTFWVDPKNDLIGVLMTQVFPPDMTLGQRFKQLTYDAVADLK
jgi:CubicO group peptidase (beta-lactamase class C family)